MNLPYRINLLARLGDYILSGHKKWQEAKEKASTENNWFIPGFIDIATQNITNLFLQKEILEKWIARYAIPEVSFTGSQFQPKTIGITMAGNIPLVGFHDWLSVFVSGHKAVIKPSSKDQALINHLVSQLEEWDKETKNCIEFRDRLTGCEAYIATGSNNSFRYFEYYFGKFPHIIRRNRSSVAILTGNESGEELEKLADDVYLYFGLGCRNVTQMYVPAGYDFVPLLEAFKKYNYLAEHHKYKNNYDYNLALHLLNKKHYMTNGSILLVENNAFPSPISQLNYAFYADKKAVVDSLTGVENLQCIVGEGFIPFGQSQQPAISDYADGVDTLEFLTALY